MYIKHLNCIQSIEYLLWHGPKALSTPAHPYSSHSYLQKVGPTRSQLLAHTLTSTGRSEKSHTLNDRFLTRSQIAWLGEINLLPINAHIFNHLFLDVVKKKQSKTRTNKTTDEQSHHTNKTAAPNTKILWKNTSSLHQVQFHSFTPCVSPISQCSMLLCRLHLVL